MFDFDFDFDVPLPLSPFAVAFSEHRSVGEGVDESTSLPNSPVYPSLQLLFKQPEDPLVLIYQLLAPRNHALRPERQRTPSCLYPAR